LKAVIGPAMSSSWKFGNTTRPIVRVMAETEVTMSFRPEPNPITISAQGTKEPTMTAQPTEPTVIAFALFPGVTQLDFTGPHEVFSRLPGARVMLASRTGEPIETDGIVFGGLRRLAD